MANILVAMSVVTSKSSSNVPKPPGNATQAIAFLISICFLTAKFSSVTDLVVNKFVSCSNGKMRLKPKLSPFLP